MSVVFRGIEKPTSCGKCFVGDRTICANGCPIFTLPPHGRLGDLDMVEAMIMEYIEEYGATKDENGNYSEKWCAMKEAEMVIQNTPTIIEAEEGE